MQKIKVFFLFIFLLFIHILLETGDKLKAEAKISFISKIEILTKSKIIEVGQIQLLEILGFDKDDNVFSTLEGVKFEWNLEKCENKLEIISLKVKNSKNKFR